MIKSRAIVHVTDDRIKIQRQGSVNTFVATQRNVKRLAQFEIGSIKVLPTRTVLVIRPTL